MSRPTILVLAVLTVLAATAARAEDWPHREYFEDYKGTSTCLECHEEEATAFFHSQHYQWRGDSSDIVNSEGQRLGKLNTINDFCTNLAANWIGEVRNEASDPISHGCSKCHAGKGKLPAEEISAEQLENIDCLICHASGYRRNLYADGEGGWEWKPVLWRNQEDLNSVSKRIVMPERKMCLHCHSGAGGGPNFKRGDIEYELADCEPEFDVHMASAGNDMQCLDCHAGSDHRVRGRGTDLSGTDLPDDRLSCGTGECHGAEPHKSKFINKHTTRIACVTCHVPSFAKSDPTDMVRDWSTPFYHEDKDKYSATITMAGDVTPVYAWYNGKTSAQLMGEPVARLADGSVGTMMPQGDRDDPDAKIHPFKLHKAKLPLIKGREWLSPIAVEEFFADGDIDKGVREGARAAYGLEDIEYEWVDTICYMGVFHEVQPAAAALRCKACHGKDSRLDWKALGYDGDPRSKKKK